MTDGTVFLFGLGVIVGIVFWELLSMYQRRWNEQMEYERQVWEARIMAERELAKMRDKDDKE